LELALNISTWAIRIREFFVGLISGISLVFNIISSAIYYVVDAFSSVFNGISNLLGITPPLLANMTAILNIGKVLGIVLGFMAVQWIYLNAQLTLTAFLATVNALNFSQLGYGIYVLGVFLYELLVPMGLWIASLWAAVAAEYALIGWIILIIAGFAALIAGIIYLQINWKELVKWFSELGFLKVLYNTMMFILTPFQYLIDLIFGIRKEAEKPINQEIGINETRTSNATGYLEQNGGNLRAIRTAQNSSGDFSNGQIGALQPTTQVFNVNLDGETIAKNVREHNEFHNTRNNK
jgi:hypothetical protein